ncbi:uncharacterized protein LOC107486071 isoform X1 [Arachis duranensis]|uniref:Uncharacterized protein LOC107486071 isoform X1 n=1 Tax=Arachis duranensis TaxID=130453 RepID=A0A6P5NJE2_ARADU|nr:uncharacterized protein LOC107486071 isoform X1 [Arachis duranensis]
MESGMMIMKSVQQNSGQNDASIPKLINPVLVSSSISLQRILEFSLKDVRISHSSSIHSSQTTTDVENVDPLTKAISSEGKFVHAMWSGVTEMDPKLRGAVLFAGAVFQFHQLANMTSSATLDFQAGNLSGTDLNFGKAFFTLFPEMVRITAFIWCFFLEVILLLRVHPAAQCALMLLMMYAPLYYFADLARKASGIGVNCKTFKMPALWFAAVGGVGISLVAGLMILVVVYGAWLYTHKRGLTVREVVISPNDITHTLDNI